MSLGKAELCKQLLQAMADKITKLEAKQIVDCYFEAICATLASGENVSLSGLGTFVCAIKKLGQAAIQRLSRRMLSKRDA